MTIGGASQGSREINERIASVPPTEAPTATSVSVMGTRPEVNGRITSASFPGWNRDGTLEGADHERSKLAVDVISVIGGLFGGTPLSHAGVEKNTAAGKA